MIGNINYVDKCMAQQREIKEQQETIDKLKALLERSYASPLEKKPSQWVEEYRRLMFK